MVNLTEVFLFSGKVMTNCVGNASLSSRNGVEEIASCLSDTFEVFSPKLFKGMKQSTPLTRHFASQGLKIKLRQDATSKP